VTRCLSIAGTGGARRPNDWDHPRSPFSQFLRAQGIHPLVEDDARRYGWSTVLDGVDDSDDTWDASGRNLYHYFVPPLGTGLPAIAPEETFIIGHSHAGNVIAHACGKYGLRINGLITVGTPIRGNLRELYAAAAPNIARHLHLHAGWRDYWQVFGALFDGRFGIHREHPEAERNDRMPKGHGDILRDPSLFNVWLQRGWLEVLRDEQIGAGYVGV
jgi:pimeloyl-ACP methyl ester carboxylesterase